VQIYSCWEVRPFHDLYVIIPGALKRRKLQKQIKLILKFLHRIGPNIGTAAVSVIHGNDPYRVII